MQAGSDTQKPAAPGNTRGTRTGSGFEIIGIRLRGGKRSKIRMKTMLLNLHPLRTAFSQPQD